MKSGQTCSIKRLAHGARVRGCRLGVSTDSVGLREPFIMPYQGARGETAGVNATLYPTATLPGETA